MRFLSDSPDATEALAVRVAKLLMPGPDPGGWFVTILLGIAGSWVGGFLFGLIGLTGSATSLVGAILGAMLLLLVYRMVAGRT